VRTRGTALAVVEALLLSCLSLFLCAVQLIGLVLLVSDLKVLWDTSEQSSFVSDGGVLSWAWRHLRDPACAPVALSSDPQRSRDWE